MIAKFIYLNILILWAVATLQAYPNPTTLDTWYPMSRDGKWGFIDAQGNWKIAPSFDSADFLFDHDTVAVSEGKKWGYIDRSGNWFAKAQFDPPATDWHRDGYQVVSINGKKGILGPEGQIVIPPQYDDMTLSKDRAWVRVGEKLGVIGFDGKWIHEPITPWQHSYQITQVEPDEGVAWFCDSAANGKIGLIDGEGNIVFTPQFDVPAYGKEPGDWCHTFKGGQIWAHAANGKYLLISSGGAVLDTEDFSHVTPWSDNLSFFRATAGGLSGLISNFGEVLLAGELTKVDPLNDGVAQYSTCKLDHTHDGDPVSTTLKGYLDSTGKPVIPAGKYIDLHELSEGLIAATKQVSGATFPYDRRAVFLDRSGNEVLNLENIFLADSFSDGLAAVTSVDNKWGYIDKTGMVKIAPQFDVATRFCRGRAWVSVPSEKNLTDKFAMIDEDGKLLTDYSFAPPEADGPDLTPPHPSSLPFAGEEIWLFLSVKDTSDSVRQTEKSSSSLGVMASVL